MKKKITALVVGIFAVVFSAKAQKPAVTFTATPAVICAGSAVVFTNTNFNAPTTWDWYFPGGFPSTYTTSVSPGSPPAIVYNTPGLYYVTCVVVNGSGRDSVTVQNCVLVVALPTAVILPPSGSICNINNGDSVLFTATGNAGNTYTWAPAAGLSATTGPKVNASPTVTTTYTCVVTNSANCQSTYTMTVYADSVHAEITGKDTICLGTIDTLIASGGASDPNSNTSYFWSNGKTTSQISVSPSVNTSYTCTVNSGNCPSSIATFTVVPEAVPVYTITYNPNGDSMCYPGGSVYIDVVPASGIYQYYFFGPFGVDTTYADSVSPDITTTYTLVVNHLGCRVDSLLKIKVNYPPDLRFTGATNLCQGSTTIIDVYGGGNGAQYHWSTGATTSSVDVRPPASITYTVSVSQGACFKDSTFTIIVDTMPNVKFTGDTSICTGDTAIVHVSGGKGVINYAWTTGSTADSIFLDTNVAGSYSYFVTVIKGACSKDSSKITINVWPHPKPGLFRSDTICQWDSTTLRATGGDYYTWLPKNSGLNHYEFFGDTDLDNASPSATTIYTVNVCTWGCCKDTSVTVNVIAGVLGAKVCCNDTVSGGTPVNLSATFNSGPYSVESWYPSTGLSCTNCPNPTATVYKDQTYVVTFLDNATGCTLNDSVTIDIFNCNVFVPNVFSPTQAVNNVLYVRSLCIQSMDFAVFDRWGNKVFETRDIDGGWDGTYHGKSMNIGTYMWYLNGLLTDGTEINKSGNVTLLR